MNSHLVNRWDAIRTSFWFVPALMSLAAVALALLCSSLNGPIGRWLSAAVPWIAVSSGAARASLTSIGGAMVSIAGVVFSVMLVTLSITSSQYGSRLLRTFMADGLTQVALGTLVGTSLFCMVALTGIHSETSAESTTNVSVILGLVLAIVSMGVLIAFIHHVVNLIQAPNVVAAVAQDLNSSLERLFPERVGREDPEEDTVDLDEASGMAIRSRKEGYLQALDADAVMSLAKTSDLFVRVEVKPGDFVERDQPIATVWPGSSALSCSPSDNESVSNARIQSNEADLSKEVNDALLLGRRRTPRQDAECALEELVEVALRALSPGINDPFPALACIDYLAAALGRAARRKMPGSLRFDDGGAPRIWTTATTFGNLMDSTFNPLRQHGCQCVAVAIRMVQALERISVHAQSENHRNSVLRHAKKLHRDFRVVVEQPDDGDDFQQAYNALCEKLSETCK